MPRCMPLPGKKSGKQENIFNYSPPPKKSILELHSFIRNLMATIQGQVNFSWLRLDGKYILMF